MIIPPPNLMGRWAVRLTFPDPLTEEEEKEMGADLKLQGQMHRAFIFGTPAIAVIAVVIALWVVF